MACLVGYGAPLADSTGLSHLAEKKRKTRFFRSQVRAQPTRSHPWAEAGVVSELRHRRRATPRATIREREGEMMSVAFGLVCFVLGRLVS